MIDLLERHRLTSFAIVLVTLQTGLAAFAPWLGFQDPYQQVIVDRMQGPSLNHLLDTDHLGRDVLARIAHGYRTSLLTSTVAVSLALMIGGSIGLLAAFYRGWFERIAMRLMDIFFAFPILLLAIGVIAIIGPGAYGAAGALTRTGTVGGTEFHAVVALARRILRTRDSVPVVRIQPAGRSASRYA